MGLLVRWAAISLLCGVVVLFGCAPTRVEVQVAGLTPDIHSLMVTATLRDHPDKKIRQPVSGRLDSFLLDVSNIPDSLSLTVGGLGPDGCRTHEGKVTAALPTGGALTVALTALATPGCRITVDPIGDGAGHVVSDPPGILCPGLCSAAFAPGTDVRLTASPADEHSYFTGWSQACSGFGGCVVTTRDDAVTVGAGFLPSQQCHGGFCWEAPLPQGNALHAVWARTASDVWAVGDRGVVLRWFGSFWAPEHSGTEADLQAVWGNGREVWIAGAQGTLLHWDGVAIRPMASPTNQTIRAIAGKDSEVWFAGDGGTLLRWDGAAWSVLPGVPNVALHALAPSADGVWIVGDGGLALFWDGRQLKTLPAGTAALHAVCIRPNGEVIVAGESGTILRWNGTGFRADAVQTTLKLYALWAGEGGDAWVAGELGRLWHFDGVSWRSASGGAVHDLFALAGSDAQNGWAVGDAGVILRWNGAQWGPQRVPDADPLIAVGTYDTDRQLVVSPQGRIQARDQGQWHTVDPGPRLPLDDAWVGQGEVWGAGPGGAVMQWAPRSGSSRPSWLVLLVSFADLHGVYRRSYDPSGAMNDVWAVGAGGEIWHIVGSRDSPANGGKILAGAQALWAIFWLDSNEGWAVGDGGTIQHLLGTSPMATASGTTERLLRVFGTRTDDVWAVGERGVILHWNGSAWSPVASGTPAGLRAGWAGSANRAWVAGDDGTLLSWDGTRFVPRSIGAAADIRALHVSANGTLFLVGSNGAILSGK